MQAFPHFADVETKSGRDQVKLGFEPRPLPPQSMPFAGLLTHSPRFETEPQADDKELTTRFCLRHPK